MKLTQHKLRELIAEELTKADKAEIKKMITRETAKAQKEFEKKFKKDEINNKGIKGYKFKNRHFEMNENDISVL